MKRLMYHLTLVGLLLFFGTIATAVQDDENVLYLPFDEGKGETAKDKSQFKNDGTLHQAKWAKGKYGNALSLSGEKGGWVEVPDAPSLDITDEITLMAWVYPTQFTTEWHRIVAKHWTAQVSPWMIYGIYQYGPGATGKTGFIISVNKGKEGRMDPWDGCPECGKPVDTPRLKLKAWTHMTATYDGQQMKLYYDGEEVAKKSFTGKLDTNDMPVSIGRNDIVNIEHYAGLIDEVAIWSVALTGDQIKEAMGKVLSLKTTQVELKNKLSTHWGGIKGGYLERD